VVLELVHQRVPQRDPEAGHDEEEVATEPASAPDTKKIATRKIASELVRPAIGYWSRDQAASMAAGDARRQSVASYAFRQIDPVRAASRGGCPHVCAQCAGRSCN
jgi:hypothetical protein